MYAMPSSIKSEYVKPIKQEKLSSIDLEEKFNFALSLIAKKNYQAALGILTLLADEHNHPASQNEIGKIYYYGHGVVDINDMKAVEYFTAAANQQHVAAKYNLGVMCLHGWGIQRNYSLAFFYFKSAAEKDHALAQYNTAVMYSKAWGVDKDDYQTMIWLEKSGYTGEFGQKRIRQLNQKHQNMTSSVHAYDNSLNPVGIQLSATEFANSVKVKREPTEDCLTSGEFFNSLFE